MSTSTKTSETTNANNANSTKKASEAIVSASETKQASKTKVKKASEYVPSKMQKSKKKANDAHKKFVSKEVFSISGLIRYAQNEGEKDVLKHLANLNEKNKTKVSFGEVIKAKVILANMSDFERFNKEGKKRPLMRYNTLLNAMGRFVKASKA
jgi:hypothetical protein